MSISCLNNTEPLTSTLYVLSLGTVVLIPIDLSLVNCKVVSPPVFLKTAISIFSED